MSNTEAAINIEKKHKVQWLWEELATGEVRVLLVQDGKVFMDKTCTAIEWLVLATSIARPYSSSVEVEVTKI